MSDKQLALLNKHLSQDYIDILEERGNQSISDFINLIIQLKQPNRWNVWIQDRLVEEVDLEDINYETLIDLDIYGIYDFITFLAEH